MFNPIVSFFNGLVLDNPDGLSIFAVIAFIMVAGLAGNK